MITANRTSFTEEAFNRKLFGRDSLDQNAAVMRFHRIDFKFAVEFVSKSNLNAGVYIRPIFFDECLFEGVVSIGNFQQAVEMTFNYCVFNNQVLVVYENVSF